MVVVCRKTKVDLKAQEEYKNLSQQLISLLTDVGVKDSLDEGQNCWASEALRQLEDAWDGVRTENHKLRILFDGSITLAVGHYVDFRDDDGKWRSGCISELTGYKKATINITSHVASHLAYFHGMGWKEWLNPVNK